MVKQFSTTYCQKIKENSLSLLTLYNSSKVRTSISSLAPLICLQIQGRENNKARYNSGDNNRQVREKINNGEGRNNNRQSREK